MFYKKTNGRLYYRSVFLLSQNKYKYKSVYLSYHNSGTLDRFVLNFDWGTRKAHENVFSLLDFRLSRSTLKAKMLFPGKIVQVRVNGGSNFQKSWQSWVPKLVYI